MRDRNTTNVLRMGEEVLVASSNGAMIRALFQDNLPSPSSSRVVLTFLTVCPLLINAIPLASNVAKKVTGLTTARINHQIPLLVEAKINFLLAPASNVAKLDIGQRTALPKILLLLQVVLKGCVWGGG